MSAEGCEFCLARSFFFNTSPIFLYVRCTKTMTVKMSLLSTFAQSPFLLDMLYNCFTLTCKRPIIPYTDIEGQHKTVQA